MRRSLEKASEAANLFKRYRTDHLELGAHEHNGFVAVIFIMIGMLTAQVYDISAAAGKSTYKIGAESRTET